MALKRQTLTTALVGFGLVFSLAACSHNPNKAQGEETKLENSEEVGAGVSVGQNDDGEVMTSSKQKLADQLRDLQKDVYEMETEIYGDTKLGRKGIFGVLRECLDSGGEVKRMPSKTILTKSEDKFKGKMVVADDKKLLSQSDEYFLDRIKRFEGYKENYEAQKDDFEDKLRVCKSEQKKQSKNTTESTD